MEVLKGSIGFHRVVIGFEEKGNQKQSSLRRTQSHHRAIFKDSCKGFASSVQVLNIPGCIIEA